MSIIYLHFLNREITRPFGTELNVGLINKILFNIFITVDSQFYSNYANIIEGNHLKNDFIKKAIEMDLIKIHAERTSLIEYWSTRDKRYDFDAKRYPYKRDIERESILINPSIIRSFSMTNHIKAKIRIDSELWDDRFRINSDKGEKRKFWEVNEKVIEQEDLAVTVSLANSILGKDIMMRSDEVDISSSNAGKYFSALYIEAICNELQANIINGISQIIFYDSVIKKDISTDIRILNYFASKINFSSINIESLISWTNHKLFKTITGLIKSIVLSLDEIIENSNAIEIIEILKENDENIFDDVKGDPDKFYFSLLKLKLRLDKKENFKYAFNKKSKMKKPILIVTATSKETGELLKIFKAKTGIVSQIMFVGNRATNFLGTIANCEIYHTQCEAGSSGTSGSQAVITEVLNNLEPSTVLMPGIAFGLNKEKQKIGDILISTYVREYEKARLGGESIVARGSKIPVSDSLLGLFRLLESKWTDSNLHFGIMMSGEKLVDNENFVKYLLEIEPEAIGGEMEGVGLFTAAYNAKVDWILIKSIVDWGMTKSDEFHIESASLASKLLFEAILVLTEK